MAAISEIVLSNQPHASTDIGKAGVLKLPIDAGALGATGMGSIEIAKPFLFQLFCLVWLYFYIDLTTLL